MSEHITVLLQESIDALKPKADSIIVDATANGGGHSAKLLEHLGNKGLLISIDVDPAACENLRMRFSGRENVRIVNNNFRNIDAVLEKEGIEHVDGILADLGWSTNQFEPQEGVAARGFSFMHDEPLLMTYGEPTTYPFTARDIVNRWDEEDIANVLYGYADERASRKIAKAIILARKDAPIMTSGKLAEIITAVMPRKGKVHPATKTFQALRIAVNDELGALTDFIDESIMKLNPGGRLAIITFHSIEDRIVKHKFQDALKSGVAINPIKKHMNPTRSEILANPRARSAKLRIIERI